MKKTLLLLSSSLLFAASSNGQVYDLTGIFDSSLATNSFSSVPGGTITGTLDGSTNILTISGTGPSDFFGLRNMTANPTGAITLRSGPALINVGVDSTGEEAGDSPLLLALSEVTPSTSPITFFDENITISAATAAEIISGNAYVHLDGDDNDLAGLVVATLVPEPSSTTLLGLGSLALLARRKR